ncbi:hypothetical protein [Clostridium sp. BL-8]|uniref:hypothetical protein n=1 Tax=Clostridium sp. BL-8 TaxID=349938 RepID=UPI0009C8C965|nr:hypothetical protein [Clostridium sp. BL-8]OOM77343.1 hypothetical protein CLOBL_30210 [Clostridium sp. BL-8]
METEVKLAYENNKEIKELFLEYTEMLVKNDHNFAKHLELQNYDSELEHLADKYGLPNGRLYIDENYSENRELKDMGGYIALLESKEDVAEIKANTIKGLLPEYTDIIKGDNGIDYYSSLFLLSDDYSIVVFSAKELHEIQIEKEL